MTTPLAPPPGGPGQGSGFTAGSMDLYGHLALPAGTSERCPHCNGVALVDANRELGTVCKLCGAPRILLPEGVPSSPELVATLRRAEGLRRSRARWRALSVVGGIGAVIALGFTGLLALVASGAVSLSVGAIFVVPTLLALIAGVAVSNGKTPEIARSLDAAWLAAATDVARAGRAQTPADLARALGIDTGKAEQLHAQLAVEAIASGSSQAAAVPSPERVRIVTHPEARGHVETSLPPDPRFDELEAKLSQRSEAVQAENEAEEEARSLAERQRTGRS